MPKGGESPRLGNVNVVEAVDLRRTYRITTGTFRLAGRATSRPSAASASRSARRLFGLLGPNGAGKTTTIKMLNTLLIPTAGSAHVLGYDVVRDAREVRRRIGYVFGGDRGLYERLSALDNLRYFAELYAVPRRAAARIGELLELVGLDGRENERVEGYSRGMRQRLHIARGLLHDPPVLFLDEPTIGVDPVGARELRALIADSPGRQDGPADHALHVRGRLSVRPDRRDRGGRDRGAGDAAPVKRGSRGRRRDRGVRGAEDALRRVAGPAGRPDGRRSRSAGRRRC